MALGALPSPLADQATQRHGGSAKIVANGLVAVDYGSLSSVTQDPHRSPNTQRGFRGFPGFTPAQPGEEKSGVTIPY